jgi:hypothetical protein
MSRAFYDSIIISGHRSEALNIGFSGDEIVQGIEREGAHGDGLKRIKRRENRQDSARAKTFCQ